MNSNCSHFCKFPTNQFIAQVDQFPQGTISLEEKTKKEYSVQYKMHIEQILPVKFNGTTQCMCVVQGLKKVREGGKSLKSSRKRKLSLCGEKGKMMTSLNLDLE